MPDTVDTLLKEMADVKTFVADKIKDGTKPVSDEIKRVGETDEGLGIFTYKYKGNPTTHMGVMAQDVQKVKPEAVKKVGGYLAVDYGAI